MRGSLCASMMACLAACGGVSAAHFVESDVPAAQGTIRAGAMGADDAGRSPQDAVTAAPAAATDLVIVDWPIHWSDERAALMLQYRRAHVDPHARDLAITPTMVVLHYTAGGSADATKRYFDRTRLEKSRRNLLRGGEVNVSAHFLVDRDGTIYRLQPETRMARHCVGLNHLAVGVENVGDERRWPLTAAQVEANARLVQHLASRYPITRVIGHHEAAQLRGSASYVELDASYTNPKSDPGPRFMTRVRQRIGELGLLLR